MVQNGNSGNVKMLNNLEINKEFQMEIINLKIYDSHESSHIKLKK